MINFKEMMNQYLNSFTNAMEEGFSMLSQVFYHTQNMSEALFHDSDKSTRLDHAQPHLHEEQANVFPIERHEQKK